MKHIYVILSASIIGGVTGWLIGDWLTWKIEEDKWARMLGEIDEFENPKTEVLDVDLMEGAKLVEKQPKKDYAGLTGPKESLAELAQRYHQEDSPYICGLDEWMDPGFPFGKETILFYKEDSVFAKQDGNIFERPQNSFGPNINLHFGDDSDDADVVYVCNPGEEMYYEIIQVDSSYKIDVLGETPPVKRRRKAAPKVDARKEAEKEKEEKEELEDADTDA